MGKPKYPLLAIAWKSLLFATGMALILFGWEYQKQSSSTQDWLKDDNARVVSTSIKTGSMYLGKGSLGTCYRGMVHYSYTTPTGTLTGENVYQHGSPCKNRRESAEQLIKPYKAGQRVTVFFNPENPRQSFLILRKTDRTGKAIMLMGALVTLRALFQIRPGRSRNRSG